MSRESHKIRRKRQLSLRSSVWRETKDAVVTREVPEGEVQVKSVAGILADYAKEKIPLAEARGQTWQEVADEDL